MEMIVWGREVTVSLGAAILISSFWEFGDGNGEEDNGGMERQMGDGP